MNPGLPDSKAYTHFYPLYCIPSLSLLESESWFGVGGVGSLQNHGDLKDPTCEFSQKYLYMGAVQAAYGTKKRQWINGLWIPYSLGSSSKLLRKQVTPLPQALNFMLRIADKDAKIWHLIHQGKTNA